VHGPPALRAQRRIVDEIEVHVDAALARFRDERRA